jgi:hypothetical protein
MMRKRPPSKTCGAPSDCPMLGNAGVADVRRAIFLGAASTSTLQFALSCIPTPCRAEALVIDRAKAPANCMRRLQRYPRSRALPASIDSLSGIGHLGRRSTWARRVQRGCARRGGANWESVVRLVRPSSPGCNVHETDRGASLVLPEYLAKRVYT